MAKKKAKKKRARRIIKNPIIQAGVNVNAAVKINTDTVLSKLLFDLELEVQRHETTTTTIDAKLNLIDLNPEDKEQKGPVPVEGSFVNSLRSLLCRLSNANTCNQDNLQQLNRLI